MPSSASSYHDREGGIAKVFRHTARFHSPISFVALLNARGIDPEVANVKNLSDMHSLLKVLGYSES
jgi:hypothetical protein